MPNESERSKFADKIETLLHERSHKVSRETLDELADCAARAVKTFLSGGPTPRPSEVARRLDVMARALSRAADALEAIGPAGMKYVLACSYANREPENFEPEEHILYLQTLAKWTQRATQTAKEEKVSMLAHKGGRPANEALRMLTIHLANRFEQILAIHPTHSEEDGYGNSLFDRYVKEALRSFAPDSFEVQHRAIDDAIERAVKDRRSVEEFTPPPFD